MGDQSKGKQDEGIPEYSEEQVWVEDGVMTVAHVGEQVGP